MTFSLSRAVTIARREYLTTVRRKAFVFSLLLTPALMFLSVMLSKSGSDDARAHARQSRIVALVDSSGALAGAPAHFTSGAVSVNLGRKNRFLAPDSFAVPLVARRFPALAPALDSLGRHGQHGDGRAAGLPLDRPTPPLRARHAHAHGIR